MHVKSVRFHLLPILALLMLPLLAYESLTPTRFKVKLVQACQLLNLHVKPDRKSQKILTQVAYGDCVENLGCIREISQRQLENEHNRTKRDFMAWKYPVWCKVETKNGQRGWVLKEFLTDTCEKEKEGK